MTGRASTPVVIPAGTTYYFELRASVSGSSGNVHNHLQRLTLRLRVSTLPALASSNFVWSGDRTAAVLQLIPIGRRLWITRDSAADNIVITRSL